MVFSEEELKAFERRAKEANQQDLAALKKGAVRFPVLLLVAFGAALLEGRGYLLIVKNPRTGPLGQFWPYFGATIAIWFALGIADWRKGKLAKNRGEGRYAIELELFGSALIGAAVSSYFEMYHSGAASVADVVFTGAFLIAGRACFSWRKSLSLRI